MKGSKFIDQHIFFNSVSVFRKAVLSSFFTEISLLAFLFLLCGRFCGFLATKLPSCPSPSLCSLIWYATVVMHSNVYEAFFRRGVFSFSFPFLLVSECHISFIDTFQINFPLFFFLRTCALYCTLYLLLVHVGGMQFDGQPSGHFTGLRRGHGGSAVFAPGQQPVGRAALQARVLLGNYRLAGR